MRPSPCNTELHVRGFILYCYVVVDDYLSSYLIPWCIFANIRSLIVSIYRYVAFFQKAFYSLLASIPLAICQCYPRLVLIRKRQNDKSAAVAVTQQLHLQDTSPVIRCRFCLNKIVVWKQDGGVEGRNLIVVQSPDHDYPGGPNTLWFDEVNRTHTHRISLVGSITTKMSRKMEYHYSAFIYSIR